MMNEKIKKSKWKSIKFFSNKRTHEIKKIYELDEKEKLITTVPKPRKRNINNLYTKLKSKQVQQSVEQSTNLLNSAKSLTNKNFVTPILNSAESHQINECNTTTSKNKTTLDIDQNTNDFSVEDVTDFELFSDFSDFFCNESEYDNTSSNQVLFEEINPRSNIEQNSFSYF